MADHPRTFQELVDAMDPPGGWRVEWQDDDGGCYVTIFSGPAAERRAQDYFEVLQTGHLRPVRASVSSY